MKLYGSADVSCIQNMTALMFIPPVTNPPPPLRPSPTKYPGFGFFVRERKIKFIRLVL